MKISELTPDIIGHWLGYIPEGVSASGQLLTDISIALPSAKSAAVSYTGRSLDELDNYEDCTIAILGLCNDYLINNRPESAQEDMNRSSKSILDKYSKNLLGGVSIAQNSL